MLLAASLPQFILSYSFYSYTFLFTRLISEIEFNSYSLVPPKPLRVSYPTGDQVSTYWLQLPYLYSLPLLAASLLLHWLASSSLYIFATQGSYLADDYGQDSWKPSHKWGIIDGTVIVLGFWPLGIVITLCAGLAMVVFPIIYGLRRLPGNMVFGACDSLVLSAACHPHVSSSSIPDQDSLYAGEGSESENGETSQVVEQELLRALSRGKLRWGVTEIPSSIPTTADDQRNMMHLSFTGADEFLSEPVDNHLYV
ncbi:uncharacterized protein F4812DRAFT_402206 [Daldinia caldariorum]|uniref:uncharacterized protein n=1 Tax=Daldinia caldariorum TaxID=326644 RepID=UPI00200737D0|nr:uncharacterized protein F4812DRAFT_402206 [Daldinia caldariorum]KAI1467602.1 hypothetical protein F4812DRAFT_402206 [Daldinia caldariorum]